MSEAKPLISVGALAARGGLVETHDSSTLEMCRGVVVQANGEALPTLKGKAAWAKQDPKKSEARRDDTGRDAGGPVSAPCPPQPASNVRPTIRPFSNPPKEDDMPKGVYPRKKRKARASADAPASTTTTSAAEKPKRARGAAAEALPRRHRGEARFGVFEDGTVHVATEHCKGTLSADDALDLLHFVEKLAAAGWIQKRGGKGAPKT
jgi:hypothetical protein